MAETSNNTSKKKIKKSRKFRKNSCNYPDISEEDLNFLLQNTTFGASEIQEWYKQVNSSHNWGQLNVMPDKVHLSSFMAPVYNSQRLKTKTINSILYFSNVVRGFMEDNPGGVIYKTKMMDMYLSVLSQTKATKFVEEIFQKYDTDHSGSIDFKEFMLGQVTRPTCYLSYISII